MRIGGTLPPHIAQAYGIRSSAPAARARSGEAASPVARIEPRDTYEPSATSGAHRLVAGKVDRPLEFDGANVAPVRSADVLPLYTRAADKIEAAVGVHLGRSLDVNG